MKKAAAVSALLMFFVAVPAYAQFDVSGFGTAVSVSLSPQYPVPGQAVHLTAQGSGVDLENSAIVWRSGGKVIAQGTGVTSADVTAGALGSEAAIEVDVQTPDGSVVSGQATVAPTQLDLLVGSDSYVPPFYLGRALPSAGTNIILQALARFKRSSGALIPEQSITYTWKRNGEVIASVFGRGRSTAVIPMQHLFANDTITVDAVSADGTRAGETSAVVSAVDPVLELYEDHPLYGIQFDQALGGSSFILESEMTFAVVPYFAQAATAGDRRLSYAWQVNGSDVTSSTASPNELTINATNSTGQAQIALEMTHATNFYLDAKGEWNVTLSSGSAVNNPFINISGQ